MIVLKNWCEIIWPPLFLLLLNVVFLGLGIFQVYPRIDIPMHFFGGLSIAVAGATFLRVMIATKRLEVINSALFFLFLFSFVGSAAALWEVLEFGGDRLLSFGDQMQRGLFDTMKDIIIGLSGGIIGATILTLRFKRGQGKDV